MEAAAGGTGRRVPRQTSSQAGRAQRRIKSAVNARARARARAAAACSRHQVVSTVRDRSATLSQDGSAGGALAPAPPQTWGSCALSGAVMAMTSLGGRDPAAPPCHGTAVVPPQCVLDQSAITQRMTHGFSPETMFSRTQTYRVSAVTISAAETRCYPRCYKPQSPSTQRTGVLCLKKPYMRQASRIVTCHVIYL